MTKVFLICIAALDGAVETSRALLQEDMRAHLQWCPQASAAQLILVQGPQLGPLSSKVPGFLHPLLQNRRCDPVGQRKEPDLPKVHLLLIPAQQPEQPRMHDSAVIEPKHPGNSRLWPLRLACMILIAERNLPCCSKQCALELFGELVNLSKAKHTLSVSSDDG